MLPGQALPDAIRRGMGLAARAVGDWCDLYRPRGPDRPLLPANRVLKLPAAFMPPRGAAAPAGYGEALVQAVLDGGYTRAGDYLAGAEGVFFIAEQPRLGPPLCVRTNRTLRLLRPAAPELAGMNRYGGVEEALAAPLLTDWPASVLPQGDGWLALLPAAAGVTLRVGDRASDELGRHGVVTGAELGALGWRLHMRQVAS